MLVAVAGNNNGRADEGGGYWDRKSFKVFARGALLVALPVSMVQVAAIGNCTKPIVCYGHILSDSGYLLVVC